ncbi:hypothetical protein [Xanthomonas arboricola]|uniref:hypothetical protein n=1 Tax=Xanthomonas arboricola TaxID=56448 RepID=UPI0012900426|nr:hypothetical protein [Xanthomonas arboricola]
MKVKVDFSVSTKNGEAIGSVDGELELTTTPLLGDTISMISTQNGIAAPLGHDFGGQLKVIDRIISPNQDEYGLTIVLSDLIVSTKDQALAFMDYFKSGYGLHANLYTE